MSLPLSDAELDAIVADVVSRTLGPRRRADSGAASGSSKRVTIGADHRGAELKAALTEHLQRHGYQVVDCGAMPGAAAADYPDIAEAVAVPVARGEAWRGIVIDAAGIGSSIAANKVSGARAALCYNLATAANSREHNDANVLVLGSEMTEISLAVQILEVWLRTPFAGGRHARRVEKISAIEKRNGPQQTGHG